MADDVLGISANLDLGNIKQSINELIQSLERVGVSAQEISDKTTKAFEEIENSGRTNSEKTQRALQVFEQVMREVNESISNLSDTSKLEVAQKRIEVLQNTLDSLNDRITKNKQKQKDAVSSGNSDLADSLMMENYQLQNALWQIQKMHKEAAIALQSLNKVQEGVENVNTTVNRGDSERTVNNINTELEHTKEELEDVGEGANKAAKETKEIGDNARHASEESKALGEIFSKIKSLAANIGIAFGIEQFAGRVMKVRGEFQQLEVAFGTMLGDEIEAEKLFNQLVETAAKTPFDLQGVASGAKQLLAYGINAEKVNETLVRLGDIAAGLSLPLNDLVYLYGTTMVQGRLFTQDMRQFTGRGIPLADELAKQFGVTKDKVQELVTAGRIGFPEVEKAIISLTSEGGKFGGLMEKQSKTISGQISNIQDSVATMFNEIGKSSEGVINAGLSLTSKLIENYEAVGKSVLTLISMYGTYKAAVITATAVHKAEAAGLAVATTAQKAHAIATMTTQRAMDLLNKTMLKNPFVLATMAIVGLTTAVIAFSKSSSVAADRAKEFADREKEQAEEIENKTNKIKQSLDAIKDENLSERERQNILVELKQIMPSVFGQYDTWIELQKNLKKATEDANASLARQKQLQTGQNIDSDFELLRKYKRYREIMNKPYTFTTEDDNKFMNEMNADKSIWSSQGTFQTTGSYIDQQIKVLSDRIEQTREAARKAASTDFDTRTSIMNALQLNEQISNLEQMKSQQVDGYIYLPDEIAPVPVSEVERRIQLSYKRLGEIRKNNDADYLTDEKKRIEELERKRKQIIADRNKTDENGDKIMTPEQYEAALKEVNNELEAARTSYKNRGGSSDKEGEKEAKKENDLAKQKIKQRLEEQKLAYEAGFAERQAQIDGRKNGTTKEIQQMKLDHDKRMVEIKRQAQEYQNANTEKLANEYDKTNTKGKGFYSRMQDNELTDKEKARIELTADQQKIIDSMITSENAAFLAKQKQIEDELIQAHASYTDKKKAIDKEYQDTVDNIRYAILEAEKRGDDERVDSLRRTLAEAAKERNKSQAQLSLSELRESPEYIRAFEDLNNTSTETLEMLIKQFEKTKQAAAQSLNPEDLNEYTKAIQQMEDVLNSRDPFKGLARSMQGLQRAQAETAQAQKVYDDVVSGQQVVKEYQLNSEGKLVEVYWTEADALNILLKKKDAEAKASNRYTKSLNEVLGEVNQLASAIKGLGETIGGTGGQILSLIGDTMTFMTSTISSIKAVSDTAIKEISAVEKASVILGIISTAIQLAQKLSSLLPSQEDFYEKAAEKQKKINDLRQAVSNYRLAVIQAQQAENNWFSTTGLQSLRDSYEQHGEVVKAYYDELFEAQERYADKASGLSKSIVPIAAGLTAIAAVAAGVFTAGAATGPLAMLGTSLASSLAGVAVSGAVAGAIGAAAAGIGGALVGKIAQSAIDSISYDGGKVAAVSNLRIQTQHRSFWRGQKTEDLTQWVKDNLGADLFDDKGLINLEAAGEILDKYGDKLVGDTKDTIERLMELREQYDEFIKEIEEYVSNMYSPLVDNMADAIWDEWLANGRDAMDSFKEYASDTFKDIGKEMVKQFLVQNIFNDYKEQLKELYAAYAASGITEEQLINAVMGATDTMMQNAERQLPTAQKLATMINNAFEERGFITDESGREDQKATYNSLEKWTYDQADELISRATAMQITGQHLYEQAVQQTQLQQVISLSVGTFREVLVGINDNIDEIIRNQDISLNHLSRIVTNTQPISDISEELVKIRKLVENQ